MTPGVLIENRFELERAVGAGGMGVVFRATDKLSGEKIAVKILRGDDPTEVERFEREGHVLAGLDHPGIVRYITHGVRPLGERYLVTEWLDGEDLEQRLARQRLTPAESLSLLRGVAVALAFAHASGVLHRDIKPSNIFLVESNVERVKLLDFGIARFVDERARLTASGVLMGTPGYMAPEQAQGKQVTDARTDVFSLGCVLFECLTGRRAFEGANHMVIFAKVILQEIPPLRTIRPDLPESVEHLLARMMARDPEARLRDAAEVVRVIDSIHDLDRRAAAPDPRSIITENHRATSPAQRASLTLNEQRIVSVVLASAPGEAFPEETLDLARVELERWGGRLDLLANGAMLVTLWGTGSAVDRAVRAARCALSLRDRLPGVALCAVTGRGMVSARVVAGEVLDRGVRTLGYTRPGEIGLDSVTAEMLDARFRVVRFRDAFLLRGEREHHAGGTLLGKHTPCVGRARELATLDAVFGGCVAESAATLVLVTGEAGTGKSRLRRELLEKIVQQTSQVEVLLGRADSLGESSPYGILADALRDAAGVVHGDPEEERRQKLAARVGRRLAKERVPRVAAFLGAMTSIPFPDASAPELRAARENAQIMGDAMRAAWEEWLTAECEAGPVVLVLEDLQWGDAATVSLIDATLRLLRDLPLLVLVLARPEIHSRFPGLWSERDTQHIKLGPLSRKASESLVRDVLGAEADAKLCAQIVDRADGNPFYLEELLRAVAAGRDEAFPDSVLGTVEARLDAEGTEAKRVLRAASVFGERFSTRGVAALLGGEDRLDDASAWLGQLAQREIVNAPIMSVRAEDAVYSFRHALVREAAYATLTPEDRALGHKLAGEWLESTGSGDAVALAEHFLRGGEPARAVRWYARGAEQALQASDLSAVIERVERGVACGAAGEDLGTLRLLQAEALLWRGELQAAEPSSTEALALLAPGSVPWLRAITQEVLAAGKLGSFARIGPWVARLRDAPAVEGARAARMVCACTCASQLVFGGRYAEADAIIDDLDASLAANPMRDAPAIAAVAEMRAFRASAAGDSGSCLRHLEAALRAFEAAGDRRNVCVSQANLGFIYSEMGDFEGAEQALRAALDATTRMGLSDLRANVMHNLGHVLGIRGRFPEAERLERQACEAFHSLGDPRLEGSARAYLAQIALLSGDAAAAERDARAATAGLIAAPPLRAGAFAVLSRALLAQRRTGEALVAAREAYALLEAAGSLEEGEALVRLAYAEALQENGRSREFHVVIAAARDHLLARAAKITDGTWRERFLRNVPDNARTLALAAEALGA